jgi:hypothetical protein
MIRPAAFILALILLVACGPLGCASSEERPVTFAVAAGGYNAAFEAAREVLREARFNIDRVDAAAGVISTEPKRSSGLATPWDGEQSSTRDEFEDYFNHQQRIVRITFEADPGAPAEAAPAPLGELDPGPDLRGYEGPIVAHILVVVERERRPGWRIESVSIAHNTFAQDPALGPRGMGGSYWVPVAQDRRLAGRLAEEIARAATRSGQSGD